MAAVPAGLATALQDRYRLDRELGQGGMATVYLAEDVKHHRPVAIKVLRPELAQALGADRFLREIEVTARLTHPHILPLLDSGNTAGFLYYVMPYVEGETLRNRLTREKQLPVDDTLQLACEVADALGYAHQHGVIHRDIKPQNILLEGRHAVVADFGIARAIDAAGGDRLTTTGVVVGTPVYMSPEQAAGERELDGRSDVYSLGCVVYELLTGQPPFTGPTAASLARQHVTAPVPSVRVARPSVPQPIEDAITRALAKVPADRFPTGEAFAAALEAGRSGSIIPTDARPLPAVAPARTRRRELVAAGMGVAVIAAGWVATRLLVPRPLSITISDITPVTTEPGAEFQPAISPDGKEVAYVVGPIGAPHLVIRKTANVAGGGEVRLADTSLLREWAPSWSPDGDFVRFLACRAAGCVWNETSSLGGAVRTITLRPGATQPAWSPDGARVAFVVRDRILVSQAGDTAARPMEVQTTEYPNLHSLAWSPDGRTIAYVNGNELWRTRANIDRSSIWIVAGDGGAPRPVVGDAFLNVSPAWLDARHLLFVSNRDGPRGVYVTEVGSQGARGEPRPIPGVADPHSISYSIGARKLAYAKFTPRQNIWSYPLGRSGPISIRDGIPVTSGSQVIELHDVSPDGRWIAYNGNIRGNSDLYKMPLGGGEAVPLTDFPGDEFFPRWSPDGREIAFERGGLTVEIMVMPAGGGVPTVLTSSLRRVNHEPSWSPGGLAIAFMTNRTGDWRIWLVSRDSVGGAWHEAVPLTDFHCMGPDWAPDGSGVLCNAGGSLVLVSPQGREVWRRDLAATYGLKLMSIYTRYSRDGRTIYASGDHRDGRQGVWAIPVAGGTPRLVVAFDDPALANPFVFLSVGPDRLYLTVAQYESDIWVANLRY